MREEVGSDDFLQETPTQKAEQAQLKVLYEEAKLAIQKRRFSELTWLDNLYLDQLETGTRPTENHDPVEWFVKRYLPTVSNKEKNDQLKRFVKSYKSILKQRNFNYLSQAETCFINDIESRINLEDKFLPNDAENEISPSPQITNFIKILDTLTETPDVETFVLEELRGFVEDNSSSDETQKNWETFEKNCIAEYIDALEEMLQLASPSQSIFTHQQAPMAAINRDYIAYLRALLHKQDTDSDQKNVEPAPKDIKEKLRYALSDEFYKKLQNFTLRYENGSIHPLNTLLTNRKLNITHLSQDMTKILDAYLGEDKNLIKSKSFFTRDHYYKGSIKTEAGELFAKVIHHLTTIGAANTLSSIKDKLKDSSSHLSEEKVQDIRGVTNKLYDTFCEIQTYYYQQIKGYYEKAIIKFYEIHFNENGLSYDEIPENFRTYCDMILSNSDQVNDSFIRLLEEPSYSRKYLKQVEHSLLCELKPELEQRKKATEIELKHLKKNIHHFVQANGMHSRLKKQEIENNSFDDFFIKRYCLNDKMDMSNFLISAAKQHKRQLNKHYVKYGTLAATLVGLGEGVVSAVALAVAIPNVIAAVILGGLVFLAGFTLNKFLLLLDSIGLFKALGFNQFSIYEDNKPLEWYKKFLNYCSAVLSFLGSGVVFAVVFFTQFMKIAHRAVDKCPAVFKTTALGVATLLAIPIALAELFGISALLHMANNGMIKKGMQKICLDIRQYFYHRFYVAMPHEWNSLLHVYSNLLEILKNLPRLLISTLLTVSTLAIMAYYLKMTFVFLSGCVAGLVALIPGATGAAFGIGQATALMNAVTTIMTFTVPLGKVILQTLDIVLKATLLLTAMTLATAAATLSFLPALFCVKNKIEYFKSIYATCWHKGFVAYAWLTSNSILVPGGLHYALMQDAKHARANIPSEAQKNDAQEASPQKSNAERICERVNSSNFIKEMLYKFFLLFNSSGQGFLFLPNGLNSLNNPIHVSEASITGLRSFGMNNASVSKNMSIAQSGTPMEGIFRPSSTSRASEHTGELTYLSTA